MTRALVASLVLAGSVALAQETAPAAPPAPSSPPVEAASPPTTTAPPANAPPTPPSASAKEDARKLFLAGKQAYQAGRVDVAAQSFEEAYRLDPVPGLLFNLAQSYRKQYVIAGDPKVLKKSIEAYRRYLAEAPTGPNRGLATEALSELAPLMAKVAPEELTPRPAAPAPSEPAPSTTAQTTPMAPPVPMPMPPPEKKTELMIVTETENATVHLEGLPAGAAPLLAQVTPGPHRATVEADGYFPAEVRVTAVEGRLIVSEAHLLPKPGHVTFEGRSGALVAVDGHEIGRLPVAPLDLPAGRHVFTAVKTGRQSWVGEVQLDRDREAIVSPELPETSQRRAAKWLLGLTCVSAAATAGAAGVWGQADSAASDLLGKYNSGSWTAQDLSDYNDDRTRRDAWRTGTFIAVGITAGLAAITGALYLFDHQPAPRVVPRAESLGPSTASR